MKNLNLRALLLILIFAISIVVVPAVSAQNVICGPDEFLAASTCVPDTQENRDAINALAARLAARQSEDDDSIYAYEVITRMDAFDAIVDNTFLPDDLQSLTVIVNTCADLAIAGESQYFGIMKVADNLYTLAELQSKGEKWVMLDAGKFDYPAESFIYSVKEVLQYECASDWSSQGSLASLQLVVYCPATVAESSYTFKTSSTRFLTVNGDNVLANDQHGLAAKLDGTDCYLIGADARLYANEIPAFVVDTVEKIGFYDAVFSDRQRRTLVSTFHVD